MEGVDSGEHLPPDKLSDPPICRGRESKDEGGKDEVPLME